ncbi:MAG TPA: aminodeoxychorismate synthase component I [Candidatus Saccharimonadales bacterium]|nr:aminodeoxychorismate synthase component I [Candidatus Saccharimonadales bacterium]
MRPILEEVQTAHTPESLLEQVGAASGNVLLRSRLFDSPQARYSFVAARPFLTFRSFGARCDLRGPAGTSHLFGDPWHVLDSLMARYELLDDLDLPFPAGGCFGYWGYELKNFCEPRLPRRAVNDLELPDCHVGFYDSLVVFDHRLEKAWIVSTGLRPDGSRHPRHARAQLDRWRAQVNSEPPAAKALARPGAARADGQWTSTLSREGFVQAVARAQQYIRAGDIYQVNLAHRMAAPSRLGGWEFYERLSSVSAAPFSAFLDAGEFQIASSSPELFLRLSGSHVTTRPIKGTRPRSADPTRDAQLSYDLQTSAKEMAELVMITDLLRNDLGRICEYGTVQVPELVRLERYPQVQHLVSTVEGRLWPHTTHFLALARCFPGGSITGAPKIRAMEIIDELEPVTRGPYTGCLGYLGFNRESQLSILIRTAVCRDQTLYYHAGAGIVADSIPEAEYEETLAKAGGFLSALGHVESTPAPTGAHQR